MLNVLYNTINPMPELVKSFFVGIYPGTTSIIPSALGYIKFVLRVGI